MRAFGFNKLFFIKMWIWVNKHIRKMKGEGKKTGRRGNEKEAERQQEREAPRDPSEVLVGGGQVKAMWGGVTLSWRFFPGCSVEVRRNMEFWTKDLGKYSEE